MDVVASEVKRPPGFPWVIAFLVAIPGFGLAGAGGMVGVGGPVGAGLVAAGALYLLFDLFVIQPKLELAAMTTVSTEVAAQEFLARALAFRDVEEVAQELGRTVVQAVGDTRVVLLAPDAQGGVRLIRAAGTLISQDIGDPTPAFLWLGDRAEPLARDDLLELQEFDGAKQTLELLDALGCNLLLPLRHRGLLLGLGALEHPGVIGAAEISFYRGIRAYATVAVANTLLDAGARGKAQLSKSFDLAAAMQESLMPDDRPVRRENFELRGLFRPVAECGGDLWAWRELRDDKILLLIADATGHGAAPALLAAVAKGAIDAHWQMNLDNLDPSKLLAALNTAVHRTGQKRYLMTAFAAVVDLRQGLLYYANAGQNFPYFLHAPGEEGAKRISPLIARGNSLGAASEARFETHTRPMGVGDKLLLFTDGLTEAGAPMMAEWGEKRFRAALAAHIDERATKLPDLLVAEVDQHVGDLEVADDITLLAFQFGASDGGAS